MNNNILTAKSLTVGYSVHGKQNIVLENLNLCLEEGKLTCLFGANGTGKSTLLRTLCGVQPPLAGCVSLHDIANIKDLSRSELAKIISIVNTDYTSVGALTVDEVVSIGRYPYTGFFGVLSRKDKQAVKNAISSVGMNDYTSRHIATLSDGERQKVMIARALAQDTRIIILDEPTSFLDAASRIETLSLLKTLASKNGKAILVSTHDISQALAIADNLWLISANRQFFSGSASEIIKARTPLEALFYGRNVSFDPARLDFISKDIFP